MHRHLSTAFLTRRDKLWVIGHIRTRKYSNGMGLEPVKKFRDSAGFGVRLGRSIRDNAAAGRLTGGGSRSQVVVIPGVAS